jgi:hypothetical protein
VIRGGRVDLDWPCGGTLPVEPAPAPGDTRGGSNAPSTPGQPTPGKPKPGVVKYVKLKLRFSRFGGSARVRTRQKVLKINLRALAPIRNLAATLRFGKLNGPVYGTGSLKVLRGKGFLRLKVTKKLKRGKYTLVVLGRDDKGRRGRASAIIRFS